MKLIVFLLVSIIASSCSFVVHVITVEWLQNWVASQMVVNSIEPSWNVRYVAMLSAIEYGIAASLLYLLARDKLLSFGKFRAAFIYALILAALHGAFLRQPLMDWVIGNPLHVVVVQNAFKWLVWILMSFVVVYGLEKTKFTVTIFKDIIKIVLLILIIFSFVLGVYLIKVYFKNEIENVNEDIISKEVKILSMANTIKVPCKKLLKPNKWYLEKYDDFSVFWMMYSGKTMIAKLVVDNNFSSAVETFENNCFKE